MANVQQNAIPLENPKQNLYQFVEDLLLIWQDIIENKYIVPRKVGYTEDKIKKAGEIKGSDYKEIPLSLKVEVGASLLWSEVTSINTIMTLLAQNRITFLQALERMPEGYVMNKQGLIDEINKMNESMAAQQTAGTLPPEMGGQPPTPPEGAAPPQTVPTTEQTPAPEGKLSYEEMAKFVDTLSPEVQAAIAKLPDAQYEEAVNQLMAADKQGMLNPQAPTAPEQGAPPMPPQ